ncbi:MAG: fused MFS/spermidine synthase [Planctomycetota bacterium]|jgi:tetratricopeptide (TPR) repeat protein
MSKSRNFLSIAVPSGTVFLSSFCIMVLELVAARLIAKHLGSSLYTWTAVIGVVLAGITIGNYLGGRIADRFQARKALAVLFALSSVACVVTVILNNLVGDWIWLWRFGWPVRVFSHVSLVFLIPSTLLGTISPVVAKMALERGLPTGRTVGDIYAWGAAGSIAGTFATGYYLIMAMGTIAIIWIVGGVLLLLAILYWARLWVLYVWAAIFVALMTMGLAPADWAENTGAGLALREESNPNIIYEDESQYCYIAVERISQNPDRRAFMQDKLMHSDMVMDNMLDLKYSYEQIHAAVTHLLSRDTDKLSALVIGGGGYVFPRYVEKVWPGSRVDVVEIDPGVTEAAMQAFGLERDTPINTFAMDARNYVNQLLEQERTEGQKTLYDFIYEDALNDYSIPYQLTTREFNNKIAQILTDRGAYMIEMIDIYDSGLFVGAFVNTLEQTFPYVYVIAENEPRSARNTFVIIAAKRQINLDNLSLEGPVRNLDLWIMNGSEIDVLRKKARGIVLTDDYAPVENLLAPVVLASAVDLLVEEYLAQAEQLKKAGKLNESISKYKDVISTDPRLSIKACNAIGMILAGQAKLQEDQGKLQEARGKLQEAIEAFKGALEFNSRAEVKQSMSNVNYNIGAALQRLGEADEASRYLRSAIEGYREDLAKSPDSIKIVSRLGNALASVGDFGPATEYFQQAVNLNPYDINNHSMLAQALVVQERYDEAISGLKKAVAFMSGMGNKEAAAKLQKLLGSVESKKSEQNK